MANKTLWIIIGIIAVIALWIVGGYNGLVSAKETVDQTWGDVETTYQRRLDLIPNLVNTVQGAVKFEQQTQTQIAALRTGATAAKTALANAQTGSERIAAAQQADSVYSNFKALNINVENYPQLKATENFLSLQDELAGTENRVAVARQRFNEAVKTYNVKTKRFPTNILAGIFGFEEEEFFAADAGAAQAPAVEF
ncbi:MAG: LemA family protein [Nanoarchaeota archaeon]|nr:LemA family protein [Nanoarchaeota archaeon]